MPGEWVRVCPSCGAHNPPERMRCSCGALLFGVDLRRPLVIGGDDVPGAAAAPPVPGGDAEPGPQPPVPVAAEGAAEAPLRCPYPDCGQPNPAGATSCVYCNRPLRREPSAAGPGLLQLPSALRERWRVLHGFAARGAEAEILLVEPIAPAAAAPARAIAKIYRQGILPSAEVQRRIAQVDGRHCVQVFENGISDGRAYEVMEYCPLGSLRERMRAGALAPAFITDVARELVAALAAVHAASLVHRDLKPGNVLVRGEAPLDLVLTDFATASVVDSTQRFTGMARTLSYAAPEALSGVIDAKADYWALGMMLLEMAQGRHPFDGLSDAVILYQLTTRPMDADGIADAGLRKLVRGLLLRDPERRWGAAEVARWLAGDTSLPDAVDAPEGAAFARAYTVMGERCTTRQQLAVAFSRHWQAGIADMANDQLLNWFTEVQNDQDAVRVLLQLRYDSGLNPDQQLLRFILHLAPGIPPVWQGRSVELRALMVTANRALEGDTAAAQWLARVRDNRVLQTCAAAGNAPAGELNSRWSTAISDFDAAWSIWERRLRDLASAAGPSAEPRVRETSRRSSTHGNGAVFEVQRHETVIDWGTRTVREFARPAEAELHPRLLASAYDPAWVERLRGRVRSRLDGLVPRAPWVVDLGDIGKVGASDLLALDALLPAIERLADARAREAERDQACDAQERTELSGALRANLVEIGQRARHLSFLAPNVAALEERLVENAELTARVRAIGATDPDWLALRRQALRSEPITLRLRDACHRLGERRTANAGWFSRPAAQFGGLIFLAFFFLRLGRAGLMLLLAAGGGLAAWRVMPTYQMVRDIRHLGGELRRIGR